MSKKEVKTVVIKNFHAYLLWNILHDQRLRRRDDRLARKKILRLITPVLEIINEEIEILQERFAEKDEKGKKVISSQMGNRKNYKIDKEKLTDMNEAFNRYLDKEVSIDLMPTDQSAIPEIQSLLENLDSPLNYNEDKHIDEFIEILKADKPKNKKVDK